MTPRKLPMTLLAVPTIFAKTGCEPDENQRLVDMAEQQMQRQAEQTRLMSKLQSQVAEGSRQLVAADSTARQELVSLQRDLQAGFSEVGRQRDLLEGDRRVVAATRHWDPIIAASISNIGLIVACLLPLVICWFLLCARSEPANDQAVASLLVEEFASTNPRIGLAGRGASSTRRIGASTPDPDQW